MLLYKKIIVGTVAKLWSTLRDILRTDLGYPDMVNNISFTFLSFSYIDLVMHKIYSFINIHKVYYMYCLEELDLIVNTSCCINAYVTLQKHV